MLQDEGQQLANTAENIDVAVTFAQALVDKGVAYLPSVAGAIFVLVFGPWIARRIKRLVEKALGKSGNIDTTLSGFLSSFVHYGLIALVVITALGIFGVPTTSFAALIGAAGLAIGLALQGTLGPVASGVMMLGFRPFDVGDFVEAAEQAGTIKHIGLFTTELTTGDNKKVIIPDGKIFDGVITSHAGYPTRRVDFVFGVSYSDDLNKAVALIRAEIDNQKSALSNPEPVVVVDALGASSVDIICRVWVASSDYFAVKWGLTKAVKERFDAEGVSIPFPTHTIYSEKQHEFPA